MTEARQFPPVFATNNPDRDETVADTVNFLLSEVRKHYAAPANLALATAYINPQGFALIAEEVEQAPHVRIMLGAEPEEPFRRNIERGESVSFEALADHYEQTLVHDRDLVGFTVEADAASRRLVAWLRSAEDATIPRVEVRRFKKGFLHGKAFIAEHPSMPAVLAGSSNLTRAGLSWNRELNLGYPSGQHTGLVIDWFNDLWDQAEPYDLAALYEARWQPHTPYVVFLKMLRELYGLGLGDDPGESIMLPVTSFQRDGIVRATRILEELDGVLVCDEVGLGKTFIAGELIRRVSQIDRQKVLIVVPAALKDSTWLPFLHRFDLVSTRVEVVTFDELRLGTNRAVKNLDDYAFVVIDEAHNLRNPLAQRSQKVSELLHDTNPKKVVLLTATPVNNSLYDLHALVSYFVRNDAHFAPIGIPSVKDYIKAAQDRDPDTLSPEHLFDLMDRVAVRRTRRFIKDEYKGDRIMNNRGELVPVDFPTPHIKRVDYELDSLSNGLMDRVLYALAISDSEQLVVRSGIDRDPQRLSLARYAPSAYSLGNDIDGLELTNVGLLRSMLLKRLESSSAALAKTLSRLAVSHQVFLNGLDDGLVLIGDALKEYARSDVDDIGEFLDGLDDKAFDQVRDAADFELDALRLDVQVDLVLLEDLLALTRARQVAGPDDKTLELIEQLEEIADQAERPDKDGIGKGDRRKLIVFSTYSDTVESLHDQVGQLVAAAADGSPLAAYQGRVAPAIFGSSGSSGASDRSSVIAEFCPTTAGELDEDGTPRSKDLYDILITTDVLAEGVNLQQAGRMINFDLPWNPMKLVQRHGRIDRIGSPHKRVYIGVFFPAKNLDELLNLEATLQRKIAYANAAIGSIVVFGEENQGASAEVLLHDSHQEIIDIYDENAGLLVRGGGNEALSGEEYRRRLERSMKDHWLAGQVNDLPFGSGSGFVSERVRQAGYVFCARIGDHVTPWFRFVATNPDTWAALDRTDPKTGEMVPWVESDTLTCLIAADPIKEDTPQVLSDAATTQVFAAWERAQVDIHSAWAKLTDPVNLAPEIELALREAVQLVWDHGAGLGQRQPELAARLGGRWERSVVSAVRKIVRDDAATNQEKIARLDEYATEAGLQIPEQPVPLNPVPLGDIRPVCWMAVAPKETLR